MSRLYSHLLEAGDVAAVRLYERLAALRDWAACSGFAPGGPVRLLDATVVMVMLASASVLIRIADTSSDRSLSADAIAQRFSAPGLSRESSGVVLGMRSLLDSGTVLANLEARLMFVPVEAMLWNAIPKLAEPAPIRPADLDSRIDNRRTALDPLSVVILRDLPEGSQLSSGTAVSLTAWAVAAGDLDKLVVTLGKSSERTILASPVLAGIELINPAGFAEAAVQIEIRRPANIRSDEPPVVAIKAPPPKAEAVDAPEHQPRRLKAVHKRRGARRPPAAHRVVREVKAMAKRAPMQPTQKSLPVAETTAPPPASGGPAVDVINGIGKIISGFGLATSVPSPSSGFAPKAP